MIVKGDQIPLSIKLTSGETILTPNNVFDVRFKLNNFEYNYPETIKFDDNTKKWLIYLTQAQSIRMGDIMEISAQVNFGGDPNIIKTSTTKRMSIGASLFNKIWR